MTLEYPTTNYPTILNGFVQGEKLRLESLDGKEKILTPNDCTLFGDSLIHNRETFFLKNFGPIYLDGKLWGVTHLQKYSYAGALSVFPTCYHRWHFWKQQEQNPDGSWIPGTEKGIYFRKPGFQIGGKVIIPSWRWDIAGTFLDGTLRHWIFTKGYLGGRWD